MCKNIPHSIIYNEASETQTRYIKLSKCLNYWLYYSFNCCVNDCQCFRGYSSPNSLKRWCQLSTLSSVLSGLYSAWWPALSPVPCRRLLSLVTSLWFPAVILICLSPQNIRLQNQVPIPSLSSAFPSSTHLRREQGSKFVSPESESYWYWGTQSGKWDISFVMHAVSGYFRTLHTTGGHFLGKLNAWGKPPTKELRENSWFSGIQSNCLELW